MKTQQVATRRSSERGVTALFIVIFAALLLSIITVSFTAMMVREQQRSTDDEQSQSAYDSALAGVEDGKRVMAACRDSNNSASPACQAIERERCTTVTDAGIQTGELNGEVLIQSSIGGDGRQLNQAYTCVIISSDTPSYLAQLANDESIIIPLKSRENFSQVTISWYTDKNALAPHPVDEAPHLPERGAWQPGGRPALLRAQLMQYSEGGIYPERFDDVTYAHTMYLYPQTTVGGLSFGIDGRRTGDLMPESALCTTGYFPLDGYACQVTLALPGALADRTGYLRLTSLYAGTDIKVELKDGANQIVNFHDVQPKIDVTGRANDLFRRVEARVETTSPSFPYPRATVDITNNFCKAFAVANTSASYNAGGCNPTQTGN